MSWNGNLSRTQAESERSGIISHDHAETTRECLYDLKWHVTSIAHAKSLLGKLVIAAQQLPCNEVIAIGKKSSTELSSIIRYLKGDDPDVVEAAALALAVMSGQGTYTTTNQYGSHSLRTIQKGFAGAGDTLGNQIWPSATRLAEVCQQKGEAYFRGKRVIELGCGPGIPGILAAKLGAADIVLTDFEDGVLEVTRRNVEANNELGSCRIVKLDWRDNLKNFVEEHGTFDIVLAADVVYNAWHADAVATVCSHVLRWNPIAGDYSDVDVPSAMIVLGDRSAREGVELFAETMSSRGFRATDTTEATEMSEWRFVRRGDM
eukprot:m.221060 g.221060  ORF g.221060 m.221060 type:complete len:319 (-) comp19179_c0_seq4:569-1525(-)